MSPASAALAARPRQTQAQRSAAMRAKLVDAAIRCLNRHGYSATTVAMVADEAGVSRGGMLHQFPTKVDLMLEVVSFASGYDDLPDTEPNPDKRAAFTNLTDVFWRMITKPPAMAKIEIMIAARSDPVLAVRLPPIINALDEERRDKVWRMAEALGAKKRKSVDAMVTLHTSAMRGLAIELMFTKDRAQVDRAYKLLKQYKIGFVEAMMKAVGG